MMIQKRAKVRAVQLIAFDDQKVVINRHLTGEQSAQNHPQLIRGRTNFGA